MFFFVGVDIRLCNCNRSAFQAKVSRGIENFDCDGYFCIRECFCLEKPNFHKELQVINFELRMRSSALFNLRLSTWTYLFFSRRFTLIYFLRPSAISICEYLRELFFLNFLTHAQIFPKTTPFLRGLFRFKKEEGKSEMGIENCQLRITEGHPVN